MFREIHVCSILKTSQCRQEKYVIKKRMSPFENVNSVFAKRYQAINTRTRVYYIVLDIIHNFCPKQFFIERSRTNRIHLTLQTQHSTFRVHKICKTYIFLCIYSEMNKNVLSFWRYMHLIIFVCYL